MDTENRDELCVSSAIVPSSLLARIASRKSSYVFTATPFDTVYSPNRK
jgi:hypothetical protein